MNCDFDYCIYNKKFKCIIEEIEINGSGQCASCMMISLPAGELAKLKEKQLKRLLNRQKD